VRLSFRRLVEALLAGAVLLPMLAACSGSSSPSAQSTPTVSASPSLDPQAGAAEAAAACHAVNRIPPVKSQGRAAQSKYLKAVVAGFDEAKDLSAKAAKDDPQWVELADTASKEAAAFETILDASTVGTTDQGPVIAASNETNTDRPIFIKECNQAVAAAKKQ
jgi:hypothetical protein